MDCYGAKHVKVVKDGDVHVFMIQGYHEYKSIWSNPFGVEELIYE